MKPTFEVWEERAKIAKISRFIGQKLQVLEEGVCKITLPFRDEFEQIYGVVHGGLITLIADTAGYFAAATIAGDMPLATAEVKMNFVSPVYRKDLYSIGKVVKAGKQLIVCDLKVYTSEDDKLVALGLASYSRVPA
ncbi:MAG TPA: PaaI family thioesterase, partial [Acidobacteriota bacterium]|nr:PaaI family thioesterase [Acidobacteriota bacterium]